MATSGICDHGLPQSQAVFLVPPPVSPPCLLTLGGFSHRVYITSQPPEEPDVLGGKGTPISMHAGQIDTFPTLLPHMLLLPLSGPGWLDAGSCRVPWQRGVHESASQKATKAGWVLPPPGASGSLSRLRGPKAS